MSQRGVERLIGKLVTDEQFSELFFTNPQKASVHLGVDLTDEERDALCRISRDALHEFSSKLDDRICKLHVGNDAEVTA